MQTLPFSATVDALAYMVRIVREYGGIQETEGLAPVLSEWLNDPPPTKAKDVPQYVSERRYIVAWHSPDDLADCLEVSVLGTRLFVHTTTVNLLAGRCITLRNTSPDRCSLVAVKIAKEE